MFLFASYFIENDYVIRAPLVLYGAHALPVFVLIGVNVAKRFGAADSASNKRSNLRSKRRRA
jgi:hypothetical protein